ncbi:MAG: prolyl oligopeptidase family serine peptidase, partial [Acidobacteria bacterium]|nr:prolyl oligopeptidase family serine peptidase [Acidobacteriota bacterium]
QVPVVPGEVFDRLSQYSNVRSAGFEGWAPDGRGILVATRFGNSTQLHRVYEPGGRREQITFFDEPVTSGRYRPVKGDVILFNRDVGGSEFYQIFRYDTRSGAVKMITDGTSRNSAPTWSNDGSQIAFTSTMRNGRSNDLYVMNPDEPSTTRRVVEAAGGEYWGASDWSPTDERVAVARYVSANESDVFVLDLDSGELKQVSRQKGGKTAWSGARFSNDGSALFTATDLDSEFKRLVKIDLESGRTTVLSSQIPWDIVDYEVQPGGKLIAAIANQAGIGVLHFFDAESGAELDAPRFPGGIPSNLHWSPDGRELAFEMETPTSPDDVWVLTLENGRVERWTASETGGVDLPETVDMELVMLKSFDDTEISAFLYRPDAQRFPGPRPVLVVIHGGPEGQSRPGYMGAMSYVLNEMGVALVYPNVRGSSGYGKSFLQMDNAFRREDSVRDIGAVLDWIADAPGLDEERVGVYGGSYGGYMVLASVVHFGERLSAAIDVVGISSFVTFLENTQDYRRDLRRVEYGDERDPAMRKHLEAISPLNRANEMNTPLFVIQGLNDPRVPASESEQVVRAVRKNDKPVWYLLAKDEGHGFRKQKNREYQFYTMVMFLREHLLQG